MTENAHNANNATTLNAVNSEAGLADEDLPIRIYGMVEDSIVDGPGLRFGVFVQGCTHACPECHNPDSHDPQGGTPGTVGAVLQHIRESKLVKGVTLSGGEPFEQAAACAAIAKACKKMGLNVWAYTGYLLEDLQRIAALADESPAEAAADAAQADSQEPAHIYEVAKANRGSLAVLDPAGVRDLLSAVDVLVDGPFVAKLHSYELTWRGSSNQRIIDMTATRRAGKLVKWQQYSFVPQKPSNW